MEKDVESLGGDKETASSTSHQKEESDDKNTSLNLSTQSVPEGKKLTPWQEWLLKKEVAKREYKKKLIALSKNGRKTRREAVVLASQKTKEEKEQAVRDWIMKKDKVLKEGRHLQALTLQEQLKKEKDMKDITAQMAKLKFKAWKNRKEKEAKEARQQKKETTSTKSKEQGELCEKTYSRWLQTVRDREKQQLAFRQLIVRGVYNVKSSSDRNRKQPSPRKRTSGVTKRSLLCVSYCSRNLYNLN